MVNTKTSDAHRQLRFASCQEAIAEAERLAALDAQGRLTRLGNWTPGQIFAHTAAWASFPYEGFPPALPRPNAIIRFMVRFMKAGFLKKGLPRGYRIPGVEHGTIGQDYLSTAEGLARFRAAYTRLHSTKPVHPSPVFGDLAHDEWIALNLRHAELHLGFLAESSS